MAEAMMLAGLVAVESAPANFPSAPKRAVPRNYPGAPSRDASIELDRLQRCSTLPNSGFNSGFNSAAQTPRTETSGFQFTPDLEQSRPTSPILPSMNPFRLLSVCLLNLGNGLNDAAPGALIPYMETYYNLGYALVSLIFVGNAVGFIAGALFLDTLRNKLGRARTLLLAEVIIALGFVPLVCNAPFGAIVVSFFAIGFGTSLNLAMGNVFCGSLREATAALGAMHGAYGIGGTVGPLIATAIVTVGHSIWSRYYFLVLGVTLVNAALATWAFWRYEEELGRDHPLVVGNGTGGNNLKAMFKAFKSRTVVLGALFIFAYQGAEVSISGWVISFLISDRHGDPSRVGYVTAGFWAGITLGRFLLSPLAHRVGEKRFVYLTTVLAGVFQLLVWQVPNVIGDAISVSIVGLLLGPVYPCSATVFMRSIPRREQVSGMGVISAFGSSGGAAAPFTTGLLAQVAGTWVLHPVAIGLFGVMLCCWWGLREEKRREE